MGDKVKSIVALLLVGLVAGLLYAGRRSLFGVFHRMMQSPMLLMALIGVLVAIALVVVFIVYLVRSSSKAPKAETDKAKSPESPEAEAADKATPAVAAAAPKTFSRAKLRRSFNRAMKVLRTNMPGRNYKYDAPWFLLIGQDSAAKTEALRQSGLALPLSQSPGDVTDPEEPCNWWFFEHGLILDVAGDVVLRNDGRTADRKTWRYLLRLLQKHRPKRPLDGIILALPGGDLVVAEAERESVLQQISAKADNLYDRIGEAQKTLGMRLPLYVLVPGSEQVQGFRSFCREIPQRLGQTIFGWSNPYAADKGYASQWVGEAYQAMSRDVTQAKFEAFAQGTDLQESDGLFQFPHNFKATATPLKTYLDQLCKASVYQAPYMFRGVYFCGDSGIEKVRNVEPKTYFLKDLLAQKIFPEAGLARPLPKAQLTRNRAVLAAQIVAALIVLIAGLGLWRAHRHFHTEKEHLQPILEEIARDINTIENQKWSKYDGLELYHYLGRRPAVTTFEDNARNLFTGMARGLTIESVFVPSSWFSLLHEKIIRAIVLAYDEIIYKAMYVELFRKTKNVFESRRPGALIEVDKGPLLALEQMPEFIELRKFVTDLMVLEQNGDLFNRLPESDDVTDFINLEKYLYGISILPTDYERQVGKNGKPLAQQLGVMTKRRVYDPTLFKKQARYFMVLVERLYARLFKYNRVCTQLQRLAHKLEQFQMMGPSDANYELILRDLEKNIKLTEAMLENPIFAWLAGETFAPSEAFNKLLNDAEQCRFLGPVLRQEAQEAGEAAFLQLKEELRQKQTPMTGPLLARARGEAQLTLSSGLMQLKAAANKLLSYDFIEIQPSIARTIEIPPGMRLMWDEKLLADAVALLQPYEEFVNGGIDNFPPEMHQVIAGLAKNSLESNLFETVSKAQHLEPLTDRFYSDSLELAVRSEIKNFMRATPLLDRLIRASEQLDMAHAHLVLAKLLAWQANTLLEAVDGFLNEADLYGIRGESFAWWNGSTPPALTAFDAVDDRELKNHLALQQERIRYLAYQYAEPIVTFLITSGIPRSARAEKLFIRWKRILEELEKFEQKKPGNSLTTLENFIQHEMAEINLGNYFKHITAADAQARSGDYFISRKLKLQRLLYNRCRELAHVQKVTTYDELADFFNQYLAGKYPFTAGQTDAAADPEALRLFYARFDRQAAAVSDLLQADPQFGVQGQSVQRFITRMKAVRRLWAPFLDAAPEEAGALPQFDFMVDFRVNRTREKLANRILSWQLVTGDRRITYTDEAKQGRWRFGEPVEIALRWAKDGEDYPVSGGEQPGIVVDGQTVRYRFETPWALLRLLQQQASLPEDFEKMQDPQPYTLRFVIDTRRRGAEDQTEANLQARVYIRVQVMLPAVKDKPREIIQLPYFPPRAPSLAGNGGEKTGAVTGS